MPHRSRTPDRRARGGPGAPGGQRRLLAGAVEDLVVRAEIVGGDDRRRERVHVGNLLALGERRGELGGLGAFLEQRLGDEAVGGPRLDDVEVLPDVVHADDDDLAVGLAGGARPGLDAVAGGREGGDDVRIALQDADRLGLGGRRLEALELGVEDR